MKNIYFFACLILLVACNSGGKQGQNVVNAPGNTEENVIPISVDINDLSDMEASLFLDTFRYVRLETTKQSILGQIKKIVDYENEFFILDDNSSLIRFGNDGKFLCRIGKIGRGPEEFSRAQDFCIYQNEVWVHDGWKFFVYDLDGKLLRVLDRGIGGLSELSVRNFYVNDAGIYLYNGFVKDWVSINDKLVYLSDHNAFLVLKQFDISYNLDIDYHDMMHSGNVFGSVENGVLFYKFFNDTVYQLYNDGNITKYAYDFGDASLTMHERKQLKVNNTEMFAIDDHVQGVYKSFLKDDYILTCFFYNTQHLWHYKNFKSGEEHTFTKIHDDLGSAANFFHFYEDQGKMISYIPAFILKQSPKINPATPLGQLQEEVEMGDNSILVVFDLK